MHSPAAGQPGQRCTPHTSTRQPASAQCTELHLHTPAPAPWATFTNQTSFSIRLIYRYARAQHITHCTPHTAHARISSITAIQHGRYMEPSKPQTHTHTTSLCVCVCVCTPTQISARPERTCSPCYDYTIPPTPHAASVCKAYGCHVIGFDTAMIEALPCITHIEQRISRKNSRLWHQRFEGIRT